MEGYRHPGASLDVSLSDRGTNLRDVGLLSFDGIGHDGKEVTRNNP